MNDRDCWTCDAMEKYGGSFVKALATCARLADKNNLNRIKKAFIDYWTTYEKKGVEMEKAEMK